MREELQITEIQGPLKEALQKLFDEIHLGLEHGFFEYRVVCELAKERKRVFTIQAGRSYRFTISESELCQRHVG